MPTFTFTRFFTQAQRFLWFYILIMATPSAYGDSTCTLGQGTFSENFSTTTYAPNNTLLDGWGKGHGVFLRHKSGGFYPQPAAGGAAAIPSNYAFNERAWATTGGDFDNDGYPDIIALSDKSSCHLDFFPGVQNSNVQGPINTGAVTTIASGGTCGPGAVMTAGDIDGDGLLDFVVATVSNIQNAGTINTAVAYHNTGIVAGKPTFAAVNIAPMLQAYNVSWHISGTELQLFDYDIVGRNDLLVLSSSGSTGQILRFISQAGSFGFNPTAQVLVQNVGLATPIASASQTASGGNLCMASGTGISKGGSGLAIMTTAGQFDIFVGAVNEQRLIHFYKQRDGTWIRTADYGFAPGGAQFLFADDYNLDVSSDLLVVRSGSDCGGPPATGTLLYGSYSTGFDNTPTMQQVPMATGQDSIDFAASLSTASLDTINIGPAWLAGRATGRGLFTYWYNAPSTQYYPSSNTQCSYPFFFPPAAAGRNLSGFTVQNYAATTPANTGFTWYVTNDGVGFVSLSADQLAGTTPVTFSHLGAGFAWCGQWSGAVASQTASNVNYFPASTSSAIFNNYSILYSYVPTTFFSRSTLAEYSFISNTTPHDFIYSAGVNFPSFNGQLRAYDVAQVTQGSANGLQAVNTAAPIAWEAGQILSTTSGDARNLYTAYPTGTYASSSNQVVLDGRIAFSLQEVTSPSSSPNLTQMLGVTPATAASLVPFLRNGMNASNNWKFYDTGHSTPAVLMAPKQDPNYMGSGYQSFAAQQNNITPQVLIGANDGFLHAFNAQTGTETWGFTPNNSLFRLPTLNSQNAYSHNFFVDGPIDIADVLTSKGWRTIAIAGQADGSNVTATDSQTHLVTTSSHNQGAGGNNYYFALDVTNPLSPQPLWEFTEPAPQGALSCDNNPCTSKYNSTCAQNGTCAYENQMYYSNFLVSGSTLDTKGLPAGLVEAELYDNLSDPVSSSSGQWSVPSPLDATKASAARNNSYVTTSGGVCATGTTSLASQCGSLSYRFTLASNVSGLFYPWFRLWSGTSSASFAWGIDGNYVQTLFANTNGNAWVWQAGSSIALGSGPHTLTLWEVTPNLSLDTIALQQQSASAPLNSFAATPLQTCSYTCGATSSTSVCLTDPSNQEWPECGVGSGLKCCPYTASTGFCAPVSQACGTPASVMGQAYSKPSVGRFRTSAGDKWLAFFASGYDNFGLLNVGRSLYAIDAYTGAPAGEWNFPDVSGAPLPATMPAGPTLVDADGDGYVDRIYIGDLAGRLWKLNTYATAAINGQGAINTSNYTTCIPFDAGDPNQTGSRIWAPIFTKAAVAVLQSTTPNIYFGTGGDDRAPDTITYNFYSIRDSDAMNQCSSPGRKTSSLTLSNLEWTLNDGNPGDRFWSDPLVVNNTTLYFSSFFGDIEGTNPCSDQGGSQVYAYAINRFTDAQGVVHNPGTSILKGGLAYLTAASKVRTAAILRNSTPSQVVRGNAGVSSQSNQDVLMQLFDGDVVRLSTPGALVKAPLRMVRWREIPL